MVLGSGFDRFWLYRAPILFKGGICGQSEAQPWEIDPAGGEVALFQPQSKASIKEASKGINQGIHERNQQTARVPGLMHSGRTV